MNTIIYTDMDGTLLDHKTYTYKPAIEMLDYIKEKKIPLILTSSKTRQEIILWQKKLNIHEPFISENGAAIFFPEGYKGFDLSSYPIMEGYRVALLGKDYSFITTYLETIRDKYSIKGFAQMSTEEVVKETGLSNKNAEIAKNRDFTEPFLIEDSSLVPLLEKEAKIYGLKITQGGRFFHCIGAYQDKGKALEIAQAIYRRNGYEAKSIALGDGKNDESMLLSSDIAIQIPNHENEFVKMDVPNVIKAKYSGPKGWANSLKEIL